MYKSHLFWAFAFIGVSTATSAQDFTPPIETGPLTVGIRDFATLPDSVNGNSSGPARMSVLTTDPIGRLFVNDQRGPIYHLSPLGDVTEYLDIKDYAGIDLRNDSGERGLQGFAFHPDFNNTGEAGYGKLYTVQTSNNKTPTPDFDPGGNNHSHTVVLEWMVSDPSAGTYIAGGGGAPREVMRLQQPYGNHNAGLLAFNTSIGPGHADYGNLYLAMGDGGSGGDPQENGQDASNPYGAILRIDPLDPDGSGPLKYSTLSSNVLAADGDPNTLAEIYAYGLRNPQRFGWDNTTGAMFAADIGQNAVEEIDLVVNGGNYGWDEREGSFTYEGAKTAGMIDPILEYDHTNTADDIPTTIAQRAVTVGEVARNSGIEALDGNLLFGDFPTGMIFYASVDPAIPAEGSGQDPIAQLQMIDSDGNNVQLRDLINQARANRPSPLGASNRSDLRFSLGTAGEVYILNKHDGVVRVLTPVLDGDVNGDGEVDQEDLELVLNGWGDSASAIALPVGDANRDGGVGVGDLDIVLAQWTSPVAPIIVPEPGLLGLVGLGVLAICRPRQSYFSNSSIRFIPSK